MLRKKITVAFRCFGEETPVNRTRDCETCEEERRRREDDLILFLFHTSALLRMGAPDKCKYDRKCNAGKGWGVGGSELGG